MATVSRFECPNCRASCIDGETNCPRCNTLLKSPPTSAAPAAAPAQDSAQKSSGISATLKTLLQGKPDKADPHPVDDRPLIEYDPEHLAALELGQTSHTEDSGQEPRPSARKTTRVTLTGEVVETEEPDDEPGLKAPEQAAATIGSVRIVETPTEEVMTLTFCKQCGYQNPEGLKECAQCGKVLEIIAVSDFKEIEALPREWGFDALGLIWVILGVSAIFAGQFLVKTDASRASASIADYLWTGVVAVAPGVLIFMRHHFCRMLFWTMTLGSVLVWSVIFIVWITGHLHVSDKGQVGLSWLFLLSCLSAISFVLVRTNDAFDYDIGVWLGRS